MRQLGGTGSAQGLGSRRPASCVHGGVAEYHRCRADFFAEGLRYGLRLAYVSSDGVEAARADLADFSDLERLLTTGRLRVLAARNGYGAGPVFPDWVVALVAAVIEQALADGFRGPAVSADVTELIGTPADHDALARWGFRVDRYMASHPLAALCGYALELGNDTVTEFAMLHTTHRSNEARLRVFACADGAIGLAGGCDPDDVATLGRVLPRLRTVGGPALVVDLACVEYVDHRLLLTLDRFARGNGVVMWLRSAPPLASRFTELLPVSSLQLAMSGVQE